MSEAHPILIGIDGGGTSCRAALISAGRHFVASGGAANVSSDFDGATRRLRTVLDDLASQAGVPWDGIRMADGHVGLAGVMDLATQNRVALTLDLVRAEIGDDHATAIAGALGDDDGAVAAIGTGSFLGRQANGRITDVGGWGFHIGDQASGAWLGRKLLERVMLARDGIVPKSDLTEFVARDSGFGEGGIIAFSFRASPGDFARFAPDVTRAAKAGDSFAQSLLREGAKYIRDGIAALGWTEGEPLCLTGGLARVYAEWIGHDTVAAKGTPLDGALILAARHARSRGI
jgi:glucosamine kinase